MADWYVSSTQYALIPVWQPNHAYAVGDFCKPTTWNSGLGSQFVFRCSVAGTSGSSEPGWTGYPAYLNNGSIAVGTATFINVTSQSAYGWTAAAGTIYTISGNANNRPSVGDRVFVSSDHVELYTGGSNIFYSWVAQTGYYNGVVEAFSVNKAGSVPPVTADLQYGASIQNSGSLIIFDATCDNFWHGFKIQHSASSGGIGFNNWGVRTNYFKNSTFALLSIAAAPTIYGNSWGRLILDNTTMQFSNVNQYFNNGGRGFELTWINTPNAIVPGVIPNYLFANTTGFGILLLTCRGVDFHSLTTQLVQPQGNPAKILLDSCIIAPGMVRFPASPGNIQNDEVELVNCYDGSHVLTERYTSAGACAIDRVVTFSGGATDDTSTFSFKMMSNAAGDPLVMPLTLFHLDSECLLTGARTATVEVLSMGSLTNNDLAMLMEYEGTLGSSFVSFADSSPGPLGTVSALPTSSGAWSNQPANPLATWNPADRSGNVNLSNANMSASPNTSNNAGVRSTLAIAGGKAYFEVSWNPSGSSVNCGIATADAPLVVNDSTKMAIVIQDGRMFINNSNVATLASWTSGTPNLSFAVDMTTMQIWMRLNGGNWNASSTANPTTGVGGYSITPIGPPPYYPFASFNVANPIATINTGASAFAYAVPSGFSSVNSLMVMAKYQLQANFTPLMAGRVRGLIRLMKNVATVWVNPQIVVG